jgi:putative endonuclease
MEKEFYAYITTNPNRTVLYTGVTNNLQKRLVEHYSNRGDKKTFAGTNFCYCLIWHESFPTSYEAIQAEKYIKGKKRKWKESLIEKINPEWKFLNQKILGEWPPNRTVTS